MLHFMALWQVSSVSEVRHEDDMCDFCSTCSEPGGDDLTSRQRNLTAQVPEVPLTIIRVVKKMPASHSDGQAPLPSANTLPLQVAQDWLFEHMCFLISC